jgi:hypothetical protein
MSDHALVVGAEIWLPDGQALVFGSGAYGPHSGFLAASRSGRFRIGEGLPGAVRATGQALLWNELNERFLRAEVALTSDFHAAFGFPWFKGETLVAVVALLLRRGPNVVGGIEVWKLDEAIDALTYADGHYSECPEFERLSRMFQFASGVGLPGMTRATGHCEVVADVRQSGGFVRSAIAERARLKLAVSIPVAPAGQVSSVITLISSEDQPFIREVSRFERDESGVVRATTLSSEPDAPRLPTNYFRHLESAMAEVFETGIPFALADGDVLSQRTIALLLPYYSGGKVQDVTCIEF